MEISSPVATGARPDAAAQASTSQTETEQTANVTASDSTDFETFLVMLTAQIQNQDPLNPIDSTDYATQLATFSGVEQQVLTNELLESMAASESGYSSLATFATWVGMEARVAGSARFDGSPVELSFSTPPNSQENAVMISNAQGQTVARLPVEPGATSVVWDGMTGDGAPAPHGSYAVALSGFDASGAPTSADVEAFIRVSEARIGPDGPELKLADGRAILPEDVSALR